MKQETRNQMKIKHFILLLAAALFFGCNTCQPIVQTIEKEKIVEVHIRDTVIVTNADSASTHALLRCDSAYNVVVWELTTMQGERIKASSNVQKQGKDLLLSWECKEDSLVNDIQLRDSVIREFEKNTKIIQVKVIPKFYKNCTWGFWILVVLIVLTIIAKILIKIYFRK